MLISVAIDRIQKTNATLSDVVQEFKNLELAFEESDLTLSQMQKFRHRYKQCITPYHMLSYLLDPTKPLNPASLTEAEKKLCDKSRERTSSKWVFAGYYSVPSKIRAI